MQSPARHASPYRMNSSSGKPSDDWEVIRDENIPSKIKRTLSRVQFNVLEGKASVLRDGRVCSIDRTKFTFGGRNILFEVQFHDNTIWIVRLRVYYDLQDRFTHDDIMESEVVTHRYVKRNTTNIPIPEVYGYDSDFRNEVGTAYIFMEAMSGKGVVGPGSKDFILDEHKPKLYRQLAQIIIQLSLLKFPKIGMLRLDEKGQETIGAIVDCAGRKFGPYLSSIEYYWHRAKIMSTSDGPSFEGEYIVDRLRLLTIPFLVDEDHNHGPFYLTHPDFAISNMLFDGDFNLTGLVDWSGAQTSPIQSFARPPVMIVPEPLKSRPRPLSDGEIARRQLFLEIFRACEVRDRGRGASPLISQFQGSVRCMVAGILDNEAILGHGISGYVTDLLQFIFGDNIRCMEDLLEIARKE
jgi:isoamyl acetate esterase